MNCPSCLIAVPVGAVICDNCNHILDTSFLGEDITNDDDVVRHDEEGATMIKASDEGATRIKAIPLPADDGATRIKAMPLPAESKKAPAKPKPKPVVPRLYNDDDDEQSESTAHGRAKASFGEIAAPSEATTMAFDELLQDYRRLARSERITVIGAALVLLSLALPWRSTKDESDLIGLMAGGIFAGLCAALGGAAVFARRHPKVKPYVEKWREKVLQGIAGLAGLSGVLCIVYMKSNLDYVMLKRGGRLIRDNTSWPEFGVYLALIASMVMMGGAIKSWTDRHSLPE